MENAENKRKLTARQEAVIDAIATGLPLARAAETTGVSRRAIHYWLKDEAFRAALERRKQELRDAVALEVADLSVTCLTTIKDYLSGEPDKDGYVRGRPHRVELSVQLLEKMNVLGGSRPARGEKPES